MTSVSIILPTYNRADLIKETINSVLRQTYSNFELIIVDDGSEDDTQSIIQAITDCRISYYKMPHSGHTGRLKNFALRKSIGKYIAFIDSDDLWKEEKLEKQVSLLESNQQIGFSISDVTTFKGDKILIQHSYKKENVTECQNIFDLLKGNQFLIYNPTLIIRKECVEKIGLFNEQMHSGDFNFNMRLSHRFDAGIIYETLVLRRVHESNMSNFYRVENYAEYITTFEELYRDKMIDLKSLALAKTNAHFRIGKLYSSGKKLTAALPHYFTALRYGILNPVNFARLIKRL